LRALKFSGALRRMSMKACWASWRRLSAEQRCALYFGIDGVAPGGLTRQQLLKLLQS
jgi:hypothetical protein